MVEVKTTINIEEDLWKRARHYAIEQDKTFSDLVTIALEKLIPKEAKARA